MQIGDKVKVNSNHRFYPNREGIIVSFGEEESSGLVILMDLTNPSSYFSVRFQDLFAA